MKYKLVLFSIFVFSLIDCLATLWWLRLGITREMNPLMYQALSIHPIYFVLVKIFLVGAGLYLLYRYKQHMITRIGVLIAFCSYLTVLIVHCRMAFMLYL